jgi:hypothetical protein
MVLSEGGIDAGEFFGAFPKFGFPRERTGFPSYRIRKDRSEIRFGFKNGGGAFLLKAGRWRR